MPSPSHASYVLAFDRVGAGDLALVGGKGANLGELISAGLPVPGGFCVCASTYVRFLQSTGVELQIDRELQAHARKDSGGNIDELAGRLRSLITDHALPAELASPMLEAYRLLSKGSTTRVAVRSSATAEDLPGFSFAGQQDTYLGICGDAALLDAVRRCWASLWTARAITYRQTHGFQHEDVYIAVVVQEMFPSEVSGVLFTVDPSQSFPDL